MSRRSGLLGVVGVRVGVVVVMSLVASFVALVVGVSAVDAAVPVVGVDEVRVLDLDDVGVVGPVGVASSADGSELFVVEAGLLGVVKVVNSIETAGASVGLPGPLADPQAFTYLASSDELVTWRSDGSGLDRVDGSGVVTSVAVDGVPRDLLDSAIAIDDERGLFYVLDGNWLRSFDVADVEVDAPRLDVDLSAVLGGEAAGLAVDQSSGEVYVGDPSRSQVLVLDGAGRGVRTLDLSGAGIEALVDLTVAPSGDLTDSPASLSLYVIDERQSVAGPETVLVELTASVAPSARAFAAAAPATVTAAVVQSVATGTAISPPSPDSAGITWMPAQNRLLMADSEVNEYNYYAGANLWSLTTSAAVTATGTTLAWSREPTGIGFDPAGNRIFTSDDNNKRIYEVLIGPDLLPGTGDDTVVRSFDTVSYGNTDPEDVSYDTTRGWLHIADGSNKEIFTINPGPNGLFEGGGDDVITHFDTAADGINDPEGVAFDGVNNTLTVINYRSTTAAEYTIDGTLLRLINYPSSNAVHPAGGTWAPRSNGPGTSLWVVDRGIDGSTPRDGMLYELTVPPLNGGGPVVPDVDVSPGSVGFGSVGVGLSGSASVTVSNVGSAPLSVSGVSVSGVNAGLFGVVSGGAPFTVPVGGSVVVGLEFAPVGAGSFSASLSVVSDDPDESTVVVALSGVGVASSPGAGVSAGAVVTGGSSGSSLVTTSGPVAVSPGRLYVAYVTSKQSRGVVAVTGLGGSWSLVGEQCGGRSQTGVSVFVNASASSSSSVSATLVGSATNAAIAVVQYSGADLSSPIGAVSSANSNGVGGGCSGGSDSSSYALSLVAQSSSSLVTGAVAMRNKTHSPGAGFVEEFEFTQGSGGGGAGGAVQDRTVSVPGAVTVNGSFSGNVDWAAVALEIKPA